MRTKRTIITAIAGVALGAGTLAASAAAAPATSPDVTRASTTASVVTPFTDPWDYFCLPSEVGDYKQWKDVTYRCQYVAGDGPYWVALSSPTA